jgi:hypothetical protein
VAKWVLGIVAEYQKALEEEPDRFPRFGQGQLSFSRKRLIDVFLYTRYAHQPDERRSRQFNKCLAAVGGSRSELTWLFLVEVWKFALEFASAATVIAEFYDRYCQFYNVTDEVLASMRIDHPGIGTLEKKEVQEARVLREKAEELARALWDRAGRPESGHAAFVALALEQLKAATGRTDGGRAQPGAVPHS